MASMRGRPDKDFAAEVQAHLQIETDRLVEDGMEPHAAGWRRSGASAMWYGSGSASTSPGGGCGLTT